MGAYCGKSTVLLAHSNREVITVDPLENCIDEANGLTIGVKEVADLEQNITPYPNVTWIRAHSHQVPPTAIPIGLLFIDANHQGENPYKDFRHFQPSLRSGSYVAFHDYGDIYPSVKEAVARIGDALTPGVLVDTLYIAQLR